MNNPLNATDPTGLLTDPNSCGWWCNLVGDFFNGLGTFLGGLIGGGGGGAAAAPQRPGPDDRTNGSVNPNASGNLATTSVSVEGSPVTAAIYTYPGSNWASSLALAFSVGGLSSIQFLPDNALSCTGMALHFYAPPQFNLRQVVAAGQAGGINPVAANRAVGQFGQFDYQRVGTPSSFTFYSGYTPVSNINVGAYLFGVGVSKSLAGTISNSYAALFSKNAGDPNQLIYRNLGYDMAAAGKGSYSCVVIP